MAAADGGHTHYSQFGGNSHAVSRCKIFSTSLIHLGMQVPGSDFRLGAMGSPPLSHGNSMLHPALARSYSDASSASASSAGGALDNYYGLSSNTSLPDGFVGNPASLSATRFSTRRRPGIVGKRGRPAKPDPVLDAPEGITPTGVGATFFPLAAPVGAASARASSASSGIVPSPYSKRRAIGPSSSSSHIDSRPLLSMYDGSAALAAAQQALSSSASGSVSGGSGSVGDATARSNTLASSYSPNIQEAALQLLFASNLKVGDHLTITERINKRLLSAA
jgi:hypothetical protein